MCLWAQGVSISSNLCLQQLVKPSGRAGREALRTCCPTGQACSTAHLPLLLKSILCNRPDEALQVGLEV